MRHQDRQKSDGPKGPIATRALLLVALVAPACAAVPGADIEPREPGWKSSALAAPVPLVGQCPTRDAVSFQPGFSPCAVAAGWKVTTLVTDFIASPPGTYCWYQASNPDGPPDFTSLVPLGAKPDCPVVTPQLALSNPLTTPVVNLTRMSPAARAAAMADAQPTPPAGAGNVHVAVLDTAPRGYDSIGRDNDPHGRAVARTIAQLACATPASCSDRVENRLAMSYLTASFDPLEIVRDTDLGGSFGTRAELAGQLRDLLDLLEQAPPDRRQIINLSLGWEPEADGLFPIESKLALKLLLQRAACLGALTVVAAGNGTRSGALLPAGWEHEPAPDWAACKSAGFRTRLPFAVGHSTYRPLVYAIGALDATDRPLAISRPRSLTRLLAYGMRVTTDLDLPGSPPPPPMSGTSMSTAVASAAAMAAWAVAPALDPHDVMAMVYDSAVELTGRGGPQMDNRYVEQCLPTTTPCDQWAMRRVSVCGALAAATVAANAAASIAGAGAPAIAPLPVPVCATVGAYAMRDGPPVRTISWPLLPRVSSPFINTVLTQPPPPSSRSCPAATCASKGPRDGNELEPWTLPQPPRPACPSCRMTFPRNGESYLWGSTVSTLTSTDYDLDFVVTPYQSGLALAEQVVHFGTNGPRDLLLDDWLTVGGPITSAAARFEFTSHWTGRVIPTQETPIDVDPY